MKHFITIALISLLFFLASCRAIIQAPPIGERTPDIIKKPTQSTLVNQTVADIPKDTLLTTGESRNIEVVVQHDTKAEIPQGLLGGILTGEKPKEVVLPKNTEVLLPPETPLRTVVPIKVTMESGAEVLLPAGTEITTTKINWYAVLFYTIVILGVGWYYIHLRRQPEDANADGFVDNDKVVVGKKKIKKQ